MDRRTCPRRSAMVRPRTYRGASLRVGASKRHEGRWAGAGMSIEHEKQWKDLQELRRIYCLKDARTPSTSFTVHWLQLERALERYRKDIQELNRMFALEDPRSKDRG